LLFKPTNQLTWCRWDWGSTSGRRIARSCRVWLF